jgi:hypothetical protein
MSTRPLHEALPDLVARLSGSDAKPRSMIRAGVTLAVLYLLDLAVYRCKAAHREFQFCEVVKVADGLSTSISFTTSEHSRAQVDC